MMLQMKQNQQLSMTKRKRTEKSKYKHQTTGDYCTCAAYIAEMMCLRLAQYKNEGNLAFKFWSKKPWDWTFKQQLFAANKLIKQYGEKAVLRAVLEKKSIFSLKNKQMLPEIKRQADAIKKQTSEEQKLDIKKNAQNRKKSYGKKSALDKLRKLDGKEKGES